MRIAICLVLIVASAGFTAEDPREQAMKKIAEARKTRKAGLEEQSKSIADKLAKAETEYKRVVSRGFTVSQAAPFLEEVKAQKAAAASIKSRIDETGKWAPYLNPATMKDGDVGTFKDFSGSNPGFRILQVIDKTSALMERDKELFWVEINTTGMADGKLVGLGGIVLCTGTKMYNTAGGSTKTIMSFIYLGEP